MGSNPIAVAQTSDIVPISSKEFLDIHATTECRLTLTRVCDSIRTHRQYIPSPIVYYTRSWSLKNLTKILKLNLCLKNKNIKNNLRKYVILNYDKMNCDC